MNTIDVLQANAVTDNEEIARLKVEVERVTLERDEAATLADFRSGMIARLNDASVRDLAETAELRRLVERMKSERSEFARVAGVDAGDIARLTRERDTAIVEIARLRKDLQDVLDYMPLEQYRRLVAVRGRPISVDEKRGE